MWLRRNNYESLSFPFICPFSFSLPYPLSSLFTFIHFFSFSSIIHWLITHILYLVIFQPRILNKYLLKWVSIECCPPGAYHRLCLYTDYIERKHKVNLLHVHLNPGPRPGLCCEWGDTRWEENIYWVFTVCKAFPIFKLPSCMSQ